MIKITLKQRLFLFSSILFGIFLTGCQTYTQENAAMRNEMYAGDFQTALKTLDKSSTATQSRDYVLFRMEKGMLVYLMQDYDPATKLWIQADQKLDDLYTTSISKTAASFIINDSMADYVGEAHERILLPIFSSMAFFQNNDPDNSLVMIRRTYDVMNNLENENKGKNSLKYDIFSHYFSAMVYEAKTDWDNAIIEYKKALENAQKESNKSTEKESIRAKNLILQSLGRLAEYRNRKDILDLVREENPNIKWNKQRSILQEGELYIIYESGRSPIKIAKDFPVPTDRTILRVSFPEYQDVPYKTHTTEVFLGNKSLGNTILMENIGKMAKIALADRRLRDFAKLAARVIAKDIAARKLQDQNPLAGLGAIVFNLATEVADTRGWTTLPDTIQVFRVPIPANQNQQVILKPDFMQPITLNLNLKPGEKKLYRFRTSN